MFKVGAVCNDNPSPTGEPAPSPEDASSDQFLADLSPGNDPSQPRILSTAYWPYGIWTLVHSPAAPRGVPRWWTAPPSPWSSTARTAMEPHLGWTHKLQLHEMRLIVHRIMDPPQLVDLIEPAIHIQSQLSGSNSVSLPLPAVRHTAPGHRSHVSSHGTLQNSSCQNFHILPAARRVFLTYSSTPCMMEASCFSITVWVSCTIPGLRNRGPLTQDRSQVGCRCSPGPPPCAIHLSYCRRGMLLIESLAPDGR